MPNLRNQVIEGEQLAFTSDEMNFLGPDLVLKNCQISLKVTSRTLGFADASLICCDIRTKRPLNNFLWHTVKLEGCHFHGTFVGNDFGLRSDPYKGGGIADCDFTDAVLDGCRFFGCDMSSIALPRWPCFTILNLGAKLDQIVSLNWPGQLGTWAKSHSYSPTFALAATWYAPRLMERYGVEEEELRDAIARLGDIYS